MPKKILKKIKNVIKNPNLDFIVISSNFKSQLDMESIVGTAYFFFFSNDHQIRDSRP